MGPNQAQAPQPVRPVVPTPQPAAQLPGTHGRFDYIKNLVIKILIGCLVAAAALAVAAILLGGLSDILSKSLATLGLVAAHALAALAYISTGDNTKNDQEELSFFSNSVFVVIVLSFITSVLGTWQIIDGGVVGKLYSTYFVLLFAALHGDMLSKTIGKTATIDKIVRINYLFMIFVILMILPVVWLGTGQFSDFYYRGLSALGIVDATMTIVAVALHKLYINKHPNEDSKLFTANIQIDANGKQVPVQLQSAKRRTNPLLLLFAVYLIGQVVISLILGVIGRFR